METEQDGSTRRNLEQQLAGIQLDKSTLLNCPLWLESPAADFQFFAAQTLYWHCRNKFDENVASEASNLFHLIMDCLPKISFTPAKRKLEQVTALIIINAFPKYDFLIGILHSAIYNESTLRILTEVPNELERYSSLNVDQYQFKHHLSVNASLVQTLFLNCIARRQHIELILDMLPSFGAISKSFRSSEDLGTIESLLQLAILERTYSAEALHSVVGWMECGVEHLNLTGLLSTMYHLLELAESAFQAGELELVTDVCRVWRLFADLVCIQARNDFEACSRLQSSLFKLLTMECRFMEEPEVMHGLVSYLDTQSETEDQVSHYKLRQIVWDLVLSWLQNNTLVTLQLLSYSKHISPLWIALRQFLAAPVSELVETLVNNHIKPSLIVSSLIEAYQNDLKAHPETLKLIFEALISDNQVLGLVWGYRCAKIISSHEELLRITIRVIDRQLLNNPRLALQTLKYVSGSIVDEYIVYLIQNILNIPENLREETWCMFCDCIERNHSLIELATQVLKSYWPSNTRTRPLCAFISKELPLRVEMKELLENVVSPFNMQESTQDLVALWSAIVKHHGLIELGISFIPLLEAIATSTRYDSFEVISTAIQFHPKLRPSILGFLLNELVNQYPLREEWLIAALPIINRGFCSETSPSSFVVPQVWHKLLEYFKLQNSFSEDLLCQIIKFFQLSIPIIDSSTRTTVLECVLRILYPKLTDSQSEIISPLILELGQLEARSYMTLVMSICGPRNSDLASKICAARGPRQLSALLLQLKNRSF